MNIVLWILQVALAWLAVAGGVFQIFKFDELQKGVKAMSQMPQALWAVLGAVGIVAGVLLIVPGAIGVMPRLTPMAAAVMAVHSAFVCGLYLYFGDRAPLPFAAVMLVLAAFVAYGRFVLLPF